MDPLSDAKILDAWHSNAEPWTAAVRERSIESRRLVTDAAICDAILTRAPESLLDIGCGEGWLMRAMSSHGMRVTGVDAVPALVEHARAAGTADVRLATYEQIAAGALDDIRVDVAVANFALIGGAAVEALVAHLPLLLTPGGALLIQTLHPVVATGDDPYSDGWRPGSWAGFSDAFTNPAPWYFRTIGSWVALLVRAGFEVVAIDEPLHPATGRAASLILTAAPQTL